MTPAEMPGNISSACQYSEEKGFGRGLEQGDTNGYNRGYSEGHADGIEEGKQAEQAVTDSLLSDTNIGDYHNDRVTKLPSYAFAYRRSMTSISLPNVTQITAQTFNSCSNLVTAELPSLTNISSTVNFGACSSLQFVDLGFLTSIPASTFSNCSSLNVLVLRKTSGCSLTNVNAFAGTPFASGGAGGKIYVPTDLVEAYKGATNWSVLFGYGTVEFVALEGSEYE
jgi:hypothetical protein